MPDYGRLSVALGPMFAGKTTELLHQAKMADECKLRYIVIKPAMDDRYADDEVVSHDGVSLPCLSTSCLPMLEDVFDVVFIDEVQFFGMEIIPWVADLLTRGVDVRAHGLDLDWRGDPFIVSGALAAMADHVKKAFARCTKCGSAATKTLKKVGTGGSVEVGSSEKYEPRCNQHWTRPAAPPDAINA